MSMAIKNMEKPTIKIQYSPDNLATRVDIFVW